MTFFDFYDELDAELDAVIADNPAEERLHKGDDSTRKSFAFLIWFMKFYGKRPVYNLNITEGDDDTSCDIIFSTFDNVGKKIFYIVQAKWKSRKNCVEKLDSTAFKATLDDFKLVYASKKQFSTKNEHFNRQYEDLRQHLIENQYVKFVYLTLCKNNPSVSENVELFKEQYADIEIIDIERLRRDFIERRYKKILPLNPLEYDYNPEEETIILPIEQLEIEKNYLRVDAPFQCYTFFIRPQTIFDFFEKYGFKLFFSNIRNPLIASEYNKQIEQTMMNAPDFFWYYNNGITAITRDLPRRVTPTAQQIEITGFQIINGAQTVYSVYKAYRDAKNGKRGTMNKALLQLRLIQSINKAFDLDITRFTNQQNPMEARDFWANDPVQVRLQNESFETSYWYSIRKDEFREIPKNVKIISNEDFILNYIHYLNHKIPTNATLWLSIEKFNSTGTDKGEYERYFDKTTKFEDLLVAYRLNEELFSFFNLQHSENSFDLQSTDIEPHTRQLLSDLRIVLSFVFGENLNKRVFDKLNRKSSFIYNTIAFIIETRKEHFKKYWNSNFPIDLEKSIKYRQPPVTEVEIENMNWEVYFGI
jgi:AIPR protein